MNYLDTSALIKRWVTETGSDLVEESIVAGGPIATAKIAFAEIYSGLTRKMREGSLGPGGYRSACRQFEMEWESYIRVDLTDDLLRLARDLIRRHPLRGFDALHLASAIELRRTLELDFNFLAADGPLLRAADREGLRAIDVES